MLVFLTRFYIYRPSDCTVNTVHVYRFSETQAQVTACFVLSVEVRAGDT